MIYGSRFGGWGGGYTRGYLGAGIGYPYYGGIGFPGYGYGFGYPGLGYGGYGGYGGYPYSYAPF